ncbi:MAG: glycosyltransferase [Candidatus Sericytochromatia bacterium]
MTLSVIITTSPGREQNLDGCLQLLARQQLPPDEVIVVDDGSQAGEAVVQRYAAGLKLNYLWRPNDCRVALSRNLGAGRASGSLLVFLDADMLLNPFGLQAYAEYLEAFPGHALYAYYGYAAEHVASSCLLPPRQVLWCDHRFERYDPDGLEPALNMIRYPHEWAWSGNFAVSKGLFESAGGFNPRYLGWGGEDLDFASRLLKHAQIHFFLDAWAEQQLHRRDERFHTLQDSEKEVIYQSHYDEPGYKPRVLYSEAGWKRLRRAIGHYLGEGARDEGRGTRGGEGE